MEFDAESLFLRENIFRLAENDFTTAALRVFRFQYAFNPDYRAYCDLLRRTPANVGGITEIPFLPISLFKERKIMTGSPHEAIRFTSSGTTGAKTSTHFVADISLYEESFLTAFSRFYGPPDTYCIIGLLPSYLEREGSSLIYMTQRLIELSGHADSGFYLNDFEALSNVLKRLETLQQKTLLLGVSFALLDFFEAHPMNLKHTIIMETGGMKGRREELTRTELHAKLMRGSGASSIHSEYGMTELLSQAYSAGGGMFHTPGHMRVLLRKIDDPLDVREEAAGGFPENGAVNIIDLANLFSCAFIATDDAMRLHPGGKFEILGRLDNSDVRGCSLMLSKDEE